MVLCILYTCNSTGTVRGSMLLSLEYNLGILLSLEHRTHFEDCEHNVTLGNPSLYVVQCAKHIYDTRA